MPHRRHCVHRERERERERDRKKERERRLFKQCRNLSAWHCAVGVQLFKQCRNLTAGHCAAGVQLLKRCRNLSAGTVLQWCSCLSGVEIYLPGLCYRGAAV